MGGGDTSEYRADDGVAALLQIALICDAKGDGDALRSGRQARHCRGAEFKRLQRHALNTKIQEARASKFGITEAGKLLEL